MSQVENVPATRGWVERSASYSRFFPVFIVLACLATYLPGVLRLPAVDRTEVIWADSARLMVEKGDWLNPNWRGTVHPFRPIGTFWAQGAARVLAGEAHARDIRVYRLPGVLAVTLSVLALYWLSAPLVGPLAAFLAALLFGAAPLTVLLSQLAIADGLALLPATVAMLALLRIYTAGAAADTRRLALLFWAAAGAGMLVNALHTPILVTVTILGLYAFDRDLSWLKRLHMLTGLPLALVLAAPWIVVRVLQDGVPFSGLGFGKLLAALGGAQDMKLRAFPGTFLLAALLGFLPGTALLGPALASLWQEREARLARFLLAWVLGYIAYLELLSSKPGTYTVQVMFPAMALAVGLLCAGTSKPADDAAKVSGCAPRWHAIAWPPVAALFGLVLLALPYAAMREVPPVWIAPLALAVAALFGWSAARGRAGALKEWALLGTGALALFAVTLTCAVMPSIARIWPAREIARALEGCAPGPIAVSGFREPSASFVINNDESFLAPDTLREALVAGHPGYVVGELRDEKVRTLGRFQYRRMRPLACVEAYDAMRGCPLFFTIQATGSSEGCTQLEAYQCTGDFQLKAQAARETKGCD